MTDRKRRPDGTEQSIRVEIYNQTYSIRSDGDNDYILDLAEYVDKKMREISSSLHPPPVAINGFSRVRADEQRI